MIKLLVANRGEIVVSIMAMASVLEIDTVAVYAAPGTLALFGDKGEARF